jgi:membrane protease YdiL (CAAX protease family)
VTAVKARSVAVVVLEGQTIRTVFVPTLFAAALVVWGNVVSAVLGPTAQLPGGSWPFVVSGVLLSGATLLWSQRAALTRRDLGVVSDGAAAGSAIGLAIALAIALPAVAFLRSGFPLGQPIAYAPLAGIDGDALALHLALFLPFGAVLPEELAFRGALLGALLRRSSSLPAAVGSAVAFACWHVGVIFVTVGNTPLAVSPLFALAIAAAFAVVFAGGLLFAALRLRTGTLASTIALHWAFNAAVLVGLDVAS